jgi:hypothetical protein
MVRPVQVYIQVKHGFPRQIRQANRATALGVVGGGVLLHVPPLISLPTAETRPPVRVWSKPKGLPAKTDRKSQKDTIRDAHRNKCMPTGLSTVSECPLQAVLQLTYGKDALANL